MSGLFLALAAPQAGQGRARPLLEKEWRNFLTDIHWKSVLVYVDDIFVFSTYLDTQLKDIWEVLSHWRPPGPLWILRRVSLTTLRYKRWIIMCLVLSSFQIQILHASM